MRRILIGLVVCACMTSSAFAESSDTSNVLDVVGIGRATLTPEVFKLQARLFVPGKRMHEVRMEIDEQIVRLRELEELGGRDTVAVTISSLQPQYRPKRRGRGKYYGTCATVEVVFVDRSRLASILEVFRSVDIAWPVNGYSFMKSDTTMDAEVFRLAVMDAKTQAQEIARILGVELVQVLEVTIDPPPSDMYTRVHGIRLRNYTIPARADFRLEESGEVTPSEPRFDLQRYVHVKFAMRTAAGFGTN